MQREQSEKPKFLSIHLHSVTKGGIDQSTNGRSRVVGYKSSTLDQFLKIRLTKLLGGKAEQRRQWDDGKEGEHEDQSVGLMREMLGSRRMRSIQNRIKPTNHSPSHWDKNKHDIEPGIFGRVGFRVISGALA